MKMEWEKPELEVLDVNETMAGATGTRLDGSYEQGHPAFDIFS
ncbi:paeninodin family lasso peptide [Psychrobacillus sp. NPDC093180]